MTDTVVAVTLVPAEEVAGRPGVPLHPAMPRILNTVLNEHSGGYAGLMRVPAGEVLGRHRHRGMGHHVLVAEGRARAFGKVLERGSYWYVPPDHDHAVEGLAPDGCTLFYVDLPQS